MSDGRLEAYATLIDQRPVARAIGLQDEFFDGVAASGKPVNDGYSLVLLRPGRQPLPGLLRDCFFGRFSLRSRCTFGWNRVDVLVANSRVRFGLALVQGLAERIRKNQAVTSQTDQVLGSKKGIEKRCQEPII